MDIFRILSTDKTKDKDIIKRAYLMKLKNTNPEGKPKEFMQLRLAYEKALEYADSQDEVINSNEKNNLHSNKSEIDIWMEKVEKVYKNLKSRNNLDKWRELLKDDVLKNLNSKKEARYSLLEFIVENHFAPFELVTFLNKELDFIDNLDDLYEKFPKTFIDNVNIYKMYNGELPPYSLFDLKDNLEYDEINYSKNIELMYYEGCYLENNDKLDEAQRIFEELNILDEGNSYANIKLGGIHREKGEYEEAIKYYTKQIEIECNYEYYFHRIYLNMDACNFDSAYEDLKYLENVIPESSRVYDELGMYYSTIDKNEEALKYYLKAKAIEDSNEEKEVTYLNYRLANAYIELEMYEEAIKCHEEDYANSKDEDDLFQIYIIYMKMGDFKRGEEYLKQYLEGKKLSKFSLEYKYKMAQMFWKSGRLSEANKYFSLIVNSDDSEIYIDKGKFYYYMNNLNKAILSLEKGIAINEVEVEVYEEDLDISAYIYAARIYKDLGCEEQAFEYANTVLNLISEDFDEFPMNYKYAGDAYAILGEFKKAEKYLKKALNEPTCMYYSIDAIVGLIYLEILKENVDKAKKYLEEGRKIDPLDDDIIGFGEMLGC